MLRMPKPESMSEQEYKDLEDMKDKVNEIKVNRMEYAISVLRYTDTDLKHSGYKTVEQALKSIVESTKRDIDKLNKNYIRKYPD